MEVSAKAGLNVEESFLALTKAILNRKEKQSQPRELEQKWKSIRLSKLFGKKKEDLTEVPI